MTGLPGVGTYEWRIAEDRLVWSPELIRIYGLNEAPSAERGFTALVHPDDRVRVEAETTAMLEAGGTYEHEFRIVRPDGEIRTVHDRGVIERAEDGTVLAVRGVNIDITGLSGRAAPEAAPEAAFGAAPGAADRTAAFAWPARGLAGTAVSAGNPRPAQPPPAGHPWSGRLAMPPARSLVLFFVAYVAAAGFGQWLSLVPGGITLWPPGGVFLAALVYSARRHWPWWIVVGGAAELAGNVIWFGNSPPVALAIYAGNALAAMAGAWIVGRVCDAPVRLVSLREVFALAVLASGLAPVVSATVGSAALALAGLQTFSETWPLWWLGDATGMIVFAPLTLALVQDWRGILSLPPQRIPEALGLAVLLVGAVALTLGGHLPFAYLVLPPLLWAAMRFGFGGAIVSLLLTALTAALLVEWGWDGFAADLVEKRHGSVVLHLLLAISALTALLMAAVSREHRDAVLRLTGANEKLDARVAKRTAELRASERHLRLILDNTLAFIGILDPDGTLREANAPALVAGGLARDDVVGRKFWDCYWWNYDAQVAARLKTAIADAASGKTVRYDATVRMAGQSLMDIAFMVSPIRDGRGNVVLLVPSGFDITERKRAEARLAESEQRLKLASETAGIGTWDIDLQANRSVWSPELYDLLGLDRDREPSVSLFFDGVHPADAHRVRTSFQKAIAERDLFHAEFRIVRPDGTVRHVAGTGRVVAELDGTPIRMIGVNYDVTERREREEHTQLLLHELKHRAKNLLSVVQAIARQTGKGEVDGFLARFDPRVAALAAAQELLVKNEWKGVSLEDLARSQLAHLGELIGTRVRLAGPRVEITAAAAQTLGMALHELSTNAGKYGALSNENGTVDVTWDKTRGGEAAGLLTLQWTERGGPPVEPPSHRGFGSTVIDSMVRAGLGATVELDFAPDGLRWRLECGAGCLADETGELERVKGIEPSS